jgi:hypothetical protein
VQIAKCKLRSDWHGRSQDLHRGEVRQLASEPHSILNSQSSFRNSRFAIFPPPGVGEDRAGAASYHGRHHRDAGWQLGPDRCARSRSMASPCALNGGTTSQADGQRISPGVSEERVVLSD